MEKTIPHYYYLKVYKNIRTRFRFVSRPSLPLKKRKKKKVKVGIHCIKSLRGLILDTE